MSHPAFVPPYIEIEYRFDGDDRWGHLAPIRPGDAHGSAIALFDDHPTTVVFGWEGDEPWVWEGVKVGAGGDHAVVPLADLREGPVELPGPAARWRFTLVLTKGER